MIQKDQWKTSYTAIAFPLILAVNLALLLYVMTQARHADDLKAQNERELALKQQLHVEFPGLQAKVAELRDEQSALDSAVKSLAAAKADALRTIREADVISGQNESLRKAGKGLSDTLQAQRDTISEQEGQLAVVVRQQSAARAQATEAEARLAALNQQIPELEAKVRSLTDAAAEQEVLLMARKSEVASVGAELKTDRASLADTKGEVDGLNKQLAGLSKDKADWAELTALRAEKAELSARIQVLREDLKSVQGGLAELQKEKVNLESAVSDLTKRRAQLEAAATK